MVLAMKILSLALLLPLLFVVPACGGEAGAAGGAAASAMEAAKAQLGPLMAKVTGSFGELTKLFGSVTDGASAEKAKTGIEAAVGALKAPMESIKALKLDATTLAPLETLKKTAMEQVGKLMGNGDIAAKIGPALTSLKGLLGG
jgi:hypothetical protein